MRYVPKKVFILEKKYIELSYEEYCFQYEQNEEYRTKKFLPLHGMLLEVSEIEYSKFYREKRREKYIVEESTRNGEVSFEALGIQFEKRLYHLEEEKKNSIELVERKMLIKDLFDCIGKLMPDEQELIKAIYFGGLTEREYALRREVSYSVIHKKKMRVLKRMREYLSDWV